MGYQLRRDLREALGPEITGLQRAVALEIADDARDSTRRSFVTLEDLACWTGAKDTAVIRNALKRLAAAGWEFRVPIGQGKDGRVLYAVPGKRMTFLVPAFALQGGAPATPEEAPAHSEGDEGGAGAHSEGAGAHSEGAGATPFSSVPSVPSSSSDPSSSTIAPPTPRTEEEDLHQNNSTNTDSPAPNHKSDPELRAAAIVASRLADAEGGAPTPQEIPAVLEHIRDEAAKTRTNIAFIDVWVTRRDLGTLMRDLAAVRARQATPAPTPAAPSGGGAQAKRRATCPIHRQELPCLPCKGDLAAGGVEAQAVLDSYFADPDARPDLKSNRYILRALAAV